MNRALSAAVLFLTVVVAGQPASKGLGDDKTVWLDAPVPKQWNHAGRNIPRAPHGAGIDPLCQRFVYRAIRPEEKAIEKAGWFLMETAVEHNGIIVVRGQGFNDGMCRPEEYQEFVFVEGKFAGTLSPVLMTSRSDGSGMGGQIPGDGRVFEDFKRYSDHDPACCASRISTVEYEIIRADGKTLVAVKNIKTHGAN